MTRKYVVRYFVNETAAQEGYQALLGRRYTPEDIAVVTSETLYERHRKSSFANTHSFLNCPSLYLYWPEEAHTHWHLDEKTSVEFRRELYTGGVLLAVSPRGTGDEIYLDNLWGVENNYFSEQARHSKEKDSLGIVSI